MEDTIEMPSPADSLAAIEARLADKALAAHWVHPRHVHALAAAVPADGRDRVTLALYAGTKALAHDPNRWLEDPEAVKANGPAPGKPNVLIMAKDLAALVAAAKPHVGA